MSETKTSDTYASDSADDTTSTNSTNGESERLAFLKKMLEESKHQDELAQLDELRHVLEDKHQLYGYVVSFSVES